MVRLIAARQDAQTVEQVDVRRVRIVHRHIGDGAVRHGVDRLHRFLHCLTAAIHRREELGKLSPGDLRVVVGVLPRQIVRLCPINIDLIPRLPLSEALPLVCGHADGQGDRLGVGHVRVGGKGPVLHPL